LSWFARGVGKDIAGKTLWVLPTVLASGTASMMRAGIWSICKTDYGCKQESYSVTHVRFTVDLVRGHLKIIHETQGLIQLDKVTRSRVCPRVE